MQILFARWQQATSWFNPELLTIPLDDRPRLDGRRRRPRASTASRSRTSTASRSTCSTRRASTCCRCRAGSRRAERRLRGALDGRREVPDGHARTGATVTLSYGQYRAILATNRNQADRARGVPRALRHVRGNAQHVRVALQRRAAARLVPRAGARLRDDARRGAPRQQHPDGGRREPDRDDARRRRAAAPLSPAAPARARARRRTTRTTPRSRSSTSTGATRTTTCSSRIVDVGRAARRRLPGAHARAASRERLDRRLREPRQAQRRLLGAGLRRAPVHAAELQRHARRRVHAGARDGPLDAHAAVARAPAVRVLRTTRSSSPRCRRR